MAQKKFLSNAGLEHYDGKIKEYIGDHSSNDIVALKEESPATSAHSIGDYISYNHIVYEVIDDISVDDLLIVDSNIEVATLEEGTVIYSDDEQGSTSSLSYNDLGDKPQINNVELASGNNSLSALGIQGKLTFDNVPTDGSNNPVKSDGIYDSEKDIYAVMGEMGAKNLIPYPWYGPSNNESGLTFTDNGDGSLTIDGTATRGVDWIWLSRLSDQRLIKGGVSYNFTIEVVEGTISKGHISVFAAQYAQPSGGGRIAFVTKDMDSNTPVGIYNNVYTPTGAQITASPVSGVYATLYKDTVFNNFKIRVMLRLASDTDDTYQPYAKTNKQLTDEIANKVDKVEGKGLSTNDYSDTEKEKVADNTSAIEAINENGCCNIAVHNCKSTTIEGATLTVNADGSITATAPITGVWQGIASTALFKLKGGITYKLTSGLPATSGFFMQLRDENGVDLANTYQVTEATYTPLTDMNCKVAFLIHAGYSMTSDETLYPMIYDARLNPTGYVSPAMTNRELTEKIDRGSYSVVADGVKSYADLLSELYNLVTPTNFINNSETLVFSIAAYKLRIGCIDYNNRFLLGTSYIDAAARSIIIGAALYSWSGGCLYGYTENGVFTDLSNEVPTAGAVFTIFL